MIVHWLPHSWHCEQSYKLLWACLLTPLYFIDLYYLKIYMSWISDYRLQCLMRNWPTHLLWWHHHWSNFGPVYQREEMNDGYPGSCQLLPVVCSRLERWRWEWWPWQPWILGWAYCEDLMSITSFLSSVPLLDLLLSTLIRSSAEPGHGWYCFDLTAFLNGDLLYWQKNEVTGGVDEEVLKRWLPPHHDFSV